jgi:hypothetical protein
MRMRIAVILLLALAPVAACRAEQSSFLSADDIMAKVIEQNNQRDKLGGGYSGTRRYVLENHKFNKRAEMLVGVRCDPDGTKHFAIVSEDGWKSANKHVLRKMLESESETSSPQIRPATSLTRDNYEFQMFGNEFLEARPVYVIQVMPKRKDKYLFEGRVWIDAEDFAVVRVEGKPAKNPSFWTRSVHFVQQYQKAGTFWFPFSTESLTEARIFGKTEVTITYLDYRPNSFAQSVSTKVDLHRIEAHNVQN